jgi:hypothetical protein
VLTAAITINASSANPAIFNESRSPVGKKFLADQKIKAVTNTQEIPISVKNAFSDQNSLKGNFFMADPDENYNAGCIVDGRPRVRLIIAGWHCNYFFLFYESGGYTVQQVLELYKISGDKSDLIGKQNLPRDEVKTLRDLTSKLTIIEKTDSLPR